MTGIRQPLRRCSTRMPNSRAGGNHPSDLGKASPRRHKSPSSDVLTTRCSCPNSRFGMNTTSPTWGNRFSGATVTLSPSSIKGHIDCPRAMNRIECPVLSCSMAIPSMRESIETLVINGAHRFGPNEALIRAVVERLQAIWRPIDGRQKCSFPTVLPLQACLDRAAPHHSLSTE